MMVMGTRPEVKTASSSTPQRSTAAPSMPWSPIIGLPGWLVSMCGTLDRFHKAERTRMHALVQCQFPPRSPMQAAFPCVMLSTPTPTPTAAAEWSSLCDRSDRARATAIPSPITDTFRSAGLSFALPRSGLNKRLQTGPSPRQRRRAKPVTPPLSGTFLRG
jgi:hypothetical protein